MNLIPLAPAHNVLDENEQELIAIAVSSEQIHEDVIHKRFFNKKPKGTVLHGDKVSFSDEDDEDDEKKAAEKNQVLTQIMNTDFLCIDCKTREYRWVNISDITFISFVKPTKTVK